MVIMWEIRAPDPLWYDGMDSVLTVRSPDYFGGQRGLECLAYTFFTVVLQKLKKMWLQISYVFFTHLCSLFSSSVLVFISFLTTSYIAENIKLLSNKSKNSVMKVKSAD